MEFSDIIRDRYSCKKYDGRQLSQEQLSAILEAGRLAPTAKNLQEQHVYVIQSEEGLAKVDEVTPCRFGAPTVLLVAFNKDDVFTYPGDKRTSGVEDATIVATHMLLAAANEGVDSCWINKFDPERACEAFGLPADEDVLMFLDLGFAAEGVTPPAQPFPPQGTCGDGELPLGPRVPAATIRWATPYDSHRMTKELHV